MYADVDKPMPLAEDEIIIANDDDVDEITSRIFSKHIKALEELASK